MTESHSQIATQDIETMVEQYEAITGRQRQMVDNLVQTGSVDEIAYSNSLLRIDGYSDYAMPGVRYKPKQAVAHYLLRNQTDSGEYSRRLRTAVALGSSEVIPLGARPTLGLSELKALADLAIEPK